MKQNYKIATKINPDVVKLCVKRTKRKNDKLFINKKT